MAESTLFSMTVFGCALGGVVGLLFTTVAWRHRGVAVAVPFGVSSLAAAGWCLLTAALLLADTRGVATALSQARLIVIAAVPPLWFWFAVTYTGAGPLRDRRFLAATWLVPLGYALVTVSAPLHRAVPFRTSVVTAGGITAPVTPTGPVFWGFLAYASLLVVAGLSLLAWFLLRSRAVYRRQGGLVVVGGVLPMLGAGLGLAGVFPHPAVDLTGPLFVVGGVFLGVALWRADFLAVTPVATGPLVEALPAPVLVLDENGTIAEHNAAALGALGRDSLIGLPAASVHAALAGDGDRSRIQLGPDGRTFDLEHTTLGTRHVVARGRLVVLRDVTVEQRRLDRIEALQDLSQTFIEATTRETIGDAAVAFLEAELGATFAFVYALEEGVYWSIAASEMATDRGLVDERVDETHPLYSYATAAEPQFVDPGVFATDDEDRPPIVAAPLGSVGLLCLGLDRRSLADEDQQSVRILRGTMTAALSRVEREQQLGASRREVDRRTEQIEFFSGVLQHNLRNGMQVIGARADYLTRHTDEPGLAALDTVARWADDLMALADQVARITAVVTATPAERRRPMDVVPLVERQLAAFQRDHDVFLSSSLPETTSVYANDLVETVVESLLDNAVTHSDAVRPMIDVSVQTNAEFLQIRIADDGPGIDDDLKESVFEREVATSQTASGFGLYFVSVMMDFYGGSVWLEDLTEPLGARSDDVAFEYQGTTDDGDTGTARPANSTLDPEGTVAVLQFRRADVT